MFNRVLALNNRLYNGLYEHSRLDIRSGELCKMSPSKRRSSGPARGPVFKSSPNLRNSYEKLKKILRTSYDELMKKLRNAKKGFEN